MKKVGKLILISLCVLMTAVMITVSIVFAWLADDSESGAGFLQYSGEIELNAAVYYGIDNDRDGTLDEAYDNLNNLIYFEPTLVGDVLQPKSDRSLITKYAYQTLNRFEDNVYDEYISGASINLKVIVENSDVNTSDATISVNFSDLGSYFFSTAGLSTQELEQLMREKTARIMFKVEQIEARAYQKSLGVTNGFDSGYNNLIRSSVLSECNESITQIASLSEYESEDFYLWEVSNRENFISGVRVNKGELLEFDLKLTCMQTQEIYTQYQAYWEQYIEQSTLTVDEENYIRNMYRTELAYIVSDDQGAFIELTFVIDKLYIYGTQVPTGG